MASHEILGGLVQVYKRGEGRFWQCSCSIDGAQHRTTTKEEDLQPAKQFAEDWYLGLRGKARAGLLKNEKTFDEAADAFEKEYGIITDGHRSQKWTEGHAIRLRLHLRPFFGKLALSECNEAKAQDYRVHRATTPPLYFAERVAKAKAKNKDAEIKYKPPSRSTMHDEFITMRLVLKTAVRKGWLDHLPNLSPPYKTQGKIAHRPWFTPDEYKQLYTASREHAQDAQRHYKWHAEQMHDYILFMANTGLRPDEAKDSNLEHRDIKVIRDEATGKEILHIDIRGKRGTGFCKSMPGAVQPYRRLLKRAKPQKPTKEGEEALPLKYPERTDPVFPGNHIKLFNGILRRSKLKLDREGNRRTAYSLRHTYICMRLMEGADIYALAKNCRTSVEMIQKFYAAHIKDLLDTTKINVMKKKAKPKAKTSAKPKPRRKPFRRPETDIHPDL